MSSEPTQYCKWCRSAMNTGASVCHTCQHGQATISKPTVGKTLEIIGISLALIGAIFAWSQAQDAKRSLSETEKLSIAFDKQKTDASDQFKNMENKVGLIDNTLSETIIAAESVSNEVKQSSSQLADDLVQVASQSKQLQRDTDSLESTVSDSLNVLYGNMLAEIEHDRQLLDELCEDTSESIVLWGGIDTACISRRTVYASKAVHIFKMFESLTDSVAAKARIDKTKALKAICDKKQRIVAMRVINPDALVIAEMTNDEKQFFAKMETFRDIREKEYSALNELCEAVK